MLSTDFYTVYESAGKKAGGLVNLYCTAHVRRHFVRAGDANPVQLERWTEAWLDRFRALYRAHDELMAAWQENAAPGPGAEEAAAARLKKAHASWDEAITGIDTARKKQAQAPGLQEPAKKALATLNREWDGLIAHRDYPMLSLDNNLAERTIRGPVVTRRNAGGSHNGDTAKNAAVIWTVAATAKIAGLNVLTYLTPTSTNAAATAGNPSPAPRWTGSCPGTPAPKTSAPGHSRPRPDKTPATVTPSPTWPCQSATPVTGMPSHGTPETYIWPGSRWRARNDSIRSVNFHPVCLASS